MNASPDLPIIKSFFDPHALSPVIAQAYSLSDVRCRLIKATMRDVYHVTSQSGDFVALVYRANHSPISIREEIALMDYLVAQGLPVVTAVRQRNSQPLLTLKAPEGLRHTILLPFAQGVISRNPDLSIIHRYGALIAEFHRQTDGLPEPQARPIYNADTLVVQSLKVLEAALDDRPTVMDELRPIARKIYEMLQALPQTKPAFGIVHGDVIPSNALITASSSLTLIDFDLFGLGWRTYDIATYLNEIGFWEMGDTASAAFLEGYSSIRPLSRDEAQTIPLMRITRHLFSLYIPAANIDTWGSSIYFSDRLIDTTISSIRALADSLSS